MCLSDWARHLGLSRAAIQARLKKGWSIHDALSPRLGNAGPTSRERSNAGTIDFSVDS